MAPRYAEPEPSEQPKSPDLMAEMIAMETIAAALTELHGAEARLRVLRWAERVSAPPGPPLPLAAQPTPLGPAIQRLQAGVLTHGDGKVFSDAASDEAFHDAASDKTQQTTSRPAEEPLDSMIKGFVADFQQIARNWHGE
jgi:hypothetical protein